MQCTYKHETSFEVQTFDIYPYLTLTFMIQGHISNPKYSLIIEGTALIF